MEDLKEILYDDVEQKFIELQDRKKRRKIRWNRIKLLVICGGFLIVLFYFLSDISKVKSLKVSGNTYYSEQEILNMADLSYETRYVLMPQFLIVWNLEKQELIESVEVHKNWYGAIRIDVEEKKILGSMQDKDGKTYVIVPGTPIKKIEVDDKHKAQLAHFPFIGDFDEENLQKLVDAFNMNKREVEADMISMISEIHPYERSYNKHMVKLIMQDGNTLFSSYEGIPLLNDYKQVLRASMKSHVCMDLDETNASIYESSCKK
ncbi:MAG: FtsQ-type POTRA domain-containing protein [Erysipelotrichaceae bacterium]|nr:FtsQ-type POTRA domain-containing protein [Erysipelotrichaceae bacterium]